MRTLSIITLVVAAATLALSQEKVEQKGQSAAADSAVIKVESIQCGMCVRTVEKALKRVDGVKTAKVDLDAKTATVTYLATKTNLGKLEEAITKSGYSANDKKADSEAYEKLDECCKVSDEE